MKIQKLQLYIYVAILSLFCSVAYSWNYIEKGPYLQNVGKDHITIMWETTFATKSRVDYGITEDYHLFVEYPKEVRLHEVTLRLLRPNTKYYYKISCDFTTKTGSFKTAPNHNIPFKFAVYGDSRAHPDIHRSLATSISTVNPDLILHVGDLVNDGRKYYQWEYQFFEPLYDVVDHIPIFTALGNHENNAQNYFDLFSLPNNESWYSFNYSNCHFVVLDTNKNYGKNSKQYKWLINDLKRTHTKWKFVFFHHPPYGSGFHHGSDLQARKILTPIFRRYNLDIVFCGHHHIYERSYPIGSAFESKSNPVTYVITGGGGGPLHNTSPNTWTALTEKINNFCLVNIDGGKLNFKALDTNGEVIDRFTIVKEKGKYKQYLKNSIPYEQIEFERTFPGNITPPVVHLEKGKNLVQGAIKIKNPFPYLIDVKVVWHHLNDWDLKPKRKVVKIGSRKTVQIPFTFYSPKLKNIWPPPKFSVIYDTGLGTGRVTGNYLKVLLSRELSCRTTNETLELDGKLKERFWANASSANEFIKVNGSGPAQKQTIAKIARDKESIYFSLVCNESKPEKLSAYVNKRDGNIRKDEAVIVSIAPHNDDKMVYQFGVNYKGVQYDAKGGRKKWNGKWKSKTRINDNDWTVEMAIPYSVLELSYPPKKDAEWRINFFRSTRQPDGKSEWVITLNSPLSPERLGFLTMN